MKTFLLSFLILLAAPAVFGQQGLQIGFENGSWSSRYLDQIARDTVDNPLCSWQIGTPKKTFFDSAYQSKRAIVTDTANPVRPNDTSVFILKYGKNNSPQNLLTMYFVYKMDGDSGDFGRVEISTDTGNTWIDMFTQDMAYGLTWRGQKPTLRGNTNGWASFDIDLTNLWSPTTVFADTILYRFTYITDSGTTPHDGWMIDNIALGDYEEGVENVVRDKLISVYPNPADVQAFIKRQDGRSEPVTIQVFDVSGRKVFEEKALGSACTVDTRAFEAGVYYLRYVNKEGAVTKKFVVRH